VGCVWRVLFLRFIHFSSMLHLYAAAVVKVDRRITTTILRLRIGARLTRFRNCKFHNFARTISRHADDISRYSVPPSAGPVLPLCSRKNATNSTVVTANAFSGWLSTSDVNNRLDYDTIQDAILTCNQKLTWVSLIHRTEPTTKKWRKKQKN